MHDCDTTVFTSSFRYTHSFFQIDIQHLDTVSIDSINDTAKMDGNFIYGGSLDRCVQRTNNDTNRIHLFDLLNKLPINVVSSNNARKDITSEPYGLCFCGNNDSICSSMKSITVYRGQKFVVSVQAIAQGGSTATQVTAVASYDSRVNLNQVLQPLSYHCSNLTYNFYSTGYFKKLTLRSRGSCGDFTMVEATIEVTLLPCPDIFIQSNESCICEKRLQKYNTECIIDEHGNSYVVQVPGNTFWMNLLYENGHYGGIILYETCPAEYCKAKAVSIPLDDLDFQCDLNRSGVLCGACASNYSLMLGGSKCQTLLLPFAVAGLALVIFLSLRLTVATGMINSVILYANIVEANRKILFPAFTRNILTVFIAWLNLDLGFETCFYDGMTAYAQIWLQFVFPLYVWVLISLIILSSRYSITISKLIGHNPIAVLATLLLMSYTKILKTIIEVYSSVDLDYPWETVTVWLKDANVPYLQSRHLFLTVVTTLVLVFLFLPYTLLLLLGYHLYHFSGRKHFHWLNKIKPLLDSYYAPYGIHTRYWTGLLLLVRCALYIVFSSYSLEGARKSLLAIKITFTGVVIVAWLSVKLYKKHYNNILEASIYLNLIVISATSLANSSNSPAVVYFLVGIVFVIMIGIIIYHFHLSFTAKSAMWLQAKKKVSSYINKTKAQSRRLERPAQTGTSSHDPHKIVSETVIDLREPLLES